MTLAGTRPILQDELQKYELHHRARIAIKPGITGMWQVSGRSDITDFEEVVRLDTEYISNWNFGLDIKILFCRCFVGGIIGVVIYVCALLIFREQTMRQVIVINKATKKYKKG